MTYQDTDRTLLVRLVWRLRTLRESKPPGVKKQTLTDLSPRQLELIEESLLQQLRLMQQGDSAWITNAAERAAS